MKKHISKKGFTLAEVLITLVIIGIIAAILFPSIIANYNERTLKAKRQALFGRMSQAMGEMGNEFAKYAYVKDREKTAEDADDYTPTCTTNPKDCVDEGSALKFISEGLSNVYKIAAVCDNDGLTACDIPEEITRMDGTKFSLKEKGKNMLDYNPDLTISDYYPYDTTSAGFMTKNGESIMLWYNPNCGPKEKASTYTNSPLHFNDSTYMPLKTEKLFCLNMIFDLNGAKKKPNKLGEDIGFMTVFYSDAPYVVMPKAYDWKAVPDYATTNNEYGTTVFDGKTLSTYEEAKAACAALGDNVGLPSLEEGMSLQLNRELWAPKEKQGTKIGDSTTQHNYYWTSTMFNTNSSYSFLLKDEHDERIYTTGSYNLMPFLENLNVLALANASRIAGVRCVYKD